MLDTIGSARFALLTTYRRDGRAVATPLWVVRDGEAVAVWTPVGSGKIKRIRRDTRVQIGPCDFQGRPTGEQVPGVAVLLDRDGTARIRGLLARKYGLTARLTLWGSRLRRGQAGTVGIRITMD
jgi:uncharacterized protein